MLKNYIIIALRSLFKHKLYSAINIFGLAFALAFCFIVLGHISYELSFENFQVNKDNMYRVEAKFKQEDYQYTTALLPPLLGRAIAREIPEIEDISIFRLKRVSAVQIDNKRFRVVDPHPGEMHSHGNKLFFADSSYFKLFTFPLVQGNPKTVLNEPGALVISEKAADDYFHGENPVGKTLKLNDKYDCHITGILKNTPYNTQMHTDFIMSYSTLLQTEDTDDYWVKSGTDHIYLLFNGPIDINAVNAKIEAIKDEFFTPDVAANYSMNLMPFNDLMFRGFPGATGDLNPRAEPSLIITIALTAGFILLMAIANFINLATARSSDRIKEVGVRKVFGAHRSHLIKQFLGESVIITMVSSLLGLGLYEILKAQLDSAASRPMLIDFYHSPLMIAGMIVLMILVGITAGAYPALYMSRYKPIAILQSKIGTKSSRSILRKALVVFQFGIAAVFVFISFVIYRQMNLVQSIDPGFPTENVMVMEFDGPDAANECRLMKNEITANIPVDWATSASVIPGTRSLTSYGFYTTEELRREDMITANLIDVDYDFASSMDLNVLEGRGFSPDNPEDIKHGFLVNKSAIKNMDTEKLLGTRFYREDGFYEIIGVVDDFHGSTLNFGYNPINILRLNPDNCKKLLVKIPKENTTATIAAIGDLWERVLPVEQFSYKFLDDEISKGYKSIREENTMFLFLCAVTIMIACLGIFGLVSYTAAQRTKEIGIRKVMGANIKNIILLLSKEFTILIGISSLIAWPIAYMMSTDFLMYFPYKVNVGIETIAFTGLITVLLAFISAGFQAYRAARANPIETLRYE